MGPAGFGQVLADSTRTRTASSTLHDNVKATPVATLSGQSPVEPVSATGSPTTAHSDTCSSEVATVTYYPTVTVTVTASPNDALTLSTPTISQSPETTLSTEGKKQKVESSALPTTISTSSPALVVGRSETISTEATASILSTSQVPDALPSTTQAPTSVAIGATNVSPADTAANAPSTPAASSGKKRGILTSGTDQDALVSAFNNSPKITWLGNWYSAPPGKVDSHIEFVPQNYGKQSDLAPKFEWTANAKRAIAKGDKYFLSFGEPETVNARLHLEPQEAVDLFMKEMQPYADSVTIGAPAVLQNDSDLKWLSEFLELCESAKCSIGFIAIHWFWTATDEHIQSFKNAVTKAITIAKGKPVWVDNFSASGSNAAQQSFLEGVLPWLESNDAVERYSYVSPSRKTGTGFLNADGTLSPLGKFYANY